MQAWSFFDQHAPNALGKQSHAEIEDLNSIMCELFDGVKECTTVAAIGTVDRDRSTCKAATLLPKHIPFQYALCYPH